ncbi:MAG: alpha-1,2-fucosyltransferase, partial [bacterium]
IAGCIGIARANNMGFGFPKWFNHDNTLFGGNRDDFSRYFANPLPLIPDGRHWQEYGYFWGYRDVKLTKGDWSINAHLQSPKFFEHSIEEVRHYLTLKNEPEQIDYCAIHVRAGDYIDDPNAYHPRCSEEYYQKAIQMMPPGTKFMVFSDDIDFAKDRVKVKGIYVSGNYIDDFKLMKRCKHFIIANSSFSAMAALLANHPDKIVIAPERWFGPSVDISAKDIYHQNWIII